MFEPCHQIRDQFADFLDEHCPGDVRLTVRYHLKYCAACREELDRWQMVQGDLRSLPRRRVPAGQALSLRVLLSQELHRNLLGRLLVRIENAFKPLLLPASVGTLTAVVFFGLIFGLLIEPRVVRVVNTPDVPLQLTTPPRVRVLAPMDFSAGDEAVVVVTNVDADGRVMDYRILSGEGSPELKSRLDRMMLFSTFQPATLFGRPTNGEVVLSFSQITVRG
jgi:anti-sigma factor RsiW